MHCTSTSGSRANPARSGSPRTGAGSDRKFRVRHHGPMRDWFPASVATGALEERFEELAARHTGRRGFRTYDLLHVASTQLLDCDTFWSFDQKANALASLEGLKVLNPRKSTPRSS